MPKNHWLSAARLRTLPLSVSGIIVGCGLANFCSYNFSEDVLVQFTNCKTNYLIFGLAILTTIGFQVLSNFANDYGDGIKGTDANRKGEARMVASGAITPKQMKRAMLITAILTLIVAITLIYVAFGKTNFWYSLLFFALGIASIIAAIKYTVGNNAYGYSGFGDVFVFLFFGWLSVVGSYFLYTKYINVMVFLPATTIGLLSVAVLNLNNMRDRVEDAKVGKHTLTVKLGEEKSKYYHAFLILGALICVLIYMALNDASNKQFICLIAFIPLLKNLIVVFKNTNPLALDAQLKKVALSTFLFAILFAIFS